jgi:hypothetical protein
MASPKHPFSLRHLSLSAYLKMAVMVPKSNDFFGGIMIAEKRVEMESFSELESMYRFSRP